MKFTQYYDQEALSSFVLSLKLMCIYIINLYLQVGLSKDFYIFAFIFAS